MRVSRFDVSEIPRTAPCYLLDTCPYGTSGRWTQYHVSNQCVQGSHQNDRREFAIAAGRIEAVKVVDNLTGDASVETIEHRPELIGPRRLSIENTVE